MPAAVVIVGDRRRRASELNEAQTDEKGERDDKLVVSECRAALSQSEWAWEVREIIYRDDPSFHPSIVCSDDWRNDRKFQLLWSPNEARPTTRATRILFIRDAVCRRSRRRRQMDESDVFRDMHAYRLQADKTRFELEMQLISTDQLHFRGES